MVGSRSIHGSLVCGFTLLGVVATQLLIFRYPRYALSDVFSWAYWDSESWDSLRREGAVAGALSGHLLWVLLKPRQRVSRAMTVCMGANLVAWLSFLVVTPPLAPSEFLRIDAERARLDTTPGGLDLITDVSIVVAGRWHGTFFAVNSADRLLSLFAAPAIGFAELLIVPVQYVTREGTRRESFAIAGLGFALSTAFWAAFGGMVSGVTRTCRRAIRGPAPLT